MTTFNPDGSKALKADSWMSLAADFLAAALYWETVGEDSETMQVCINQAFEYARCYQRDWVYDFMYTDKEWQRKEAERKAKKAL